MRSTLGLVAIALLSFPILLMLIVTQQGASYLGTVVNVLNIVLALCAALGCWFAYKIISKSFPREKKGWFFVVLAFFLFTIGELLWAVFELVWGENVPIGSLADLFWTLGYFALIFGFYIFLSMMFFSSESYNYVIMVLSALVGGFFAYIGIPGDIVAGLTLGHFAQHFYIFLDFILLGMVLVLIIPLWRVRNRLFVTWFVFALGIAVWIIFDFLFAGMTAFGVYYSGHPVDILYAFAYVLFVFAADSKLKLVEHKVCLPVKVSKYA
jgi:hypothetical protein